MGAIASITAAATRIITGGKGRKQTANTSNASLAWDMYKTVPEVGTYADWISAAMSGATLYAGRRGPDGTVIKAPPGSRAAELVASMAGGIDGQSVMLGDLGTQLAVAGDAWLVILPDPGSDNFADDRWVVLSTEEAKTQRGMIKAIVDGVEVEIPEYDPENPDQDPDAPVAIRIWKPAPYQRQQSTSPVIRSLVILEELRLLNAVVAATARSRITGRGVLLVPAGTRFPTQPGQDVAEDSLLDTLIEVMSTAIREPESAAATVPIVLEVPSDMISGVKLVQFASEFDSLALQLRDEAIRRFATGADVPAEVLLGLGDSNHWGAWALTAEALRMGAEPRLALVCQAFTTEWLHPLLDAEGEPDAEEWLVWYDTAGLRSSSNKGASALEAFREGLINGRAARRELGFTEDDAPAGAEPEDGAASTPTDETPERTQLPVSETQTMPTQDSVTDQSEAALAATSAVLDTFMADTSAALAEAVDGLVWTALAVAGRKLIQTPACPRPERGAARELTSSATVHVRHPVTEEQVRIYHLTAGAWDRVPVVAARYGIDALTLAAGLDGYVTGLLVAGIPHEFDNVPRLLAQLQAAGLEGSKA